MSTSLPQLGIFLNVENPDGDERDALAQTVRTAVFAETLGLRDAWVAKHLDLSAA